MMPKPHSKLYYQSANQLRTNMKQNYLTLLKKYKTSQLVVALILFWVPVILFAKIAGEIIEREPIGWDIAILHWIHGLSTPLLDSLFLFVTTSGNVEYILPITILLLGYFYYKKQRFNALIILFGVGGAAVANTILKLIFHRDRPAFWHSLITETGYSFPSGHAMMSSALVLSLIVILWNTRWRIASIIIGSFIIAMIGISRLYMGVHYPTDIIAGWSVSFVWIIIVAIIVKGLSYKFHLKDLKM